MKRAAAAFLGGALLVLGAIALIVAGTLWASYVSTVLWGWFIVPLFGAPALSLAYAFGFALVVRCFVGGDKYRAGNDDSTYDHIVRIVLVFVTPLALLALGAIAKAFV